MTKTWQGDTIVFSGNTDCYQPIESKLKITRKCLEVMLKWKNPTGIITKNSLLLRDIDILEEMARLNIISVHISITSLQEKTRRLLEPRTASIKNRLKMIEHLSKKGIPVSVMVAPIIPSLNSHEVLPIVKKVADLGAVSIGHTIVRLNGAIAQIFEDWLRKTLPDSADRILNQIAECHGGQLNDSRYGARMRGEGSIAAQINDTVALAKRKYFKNRARPELDNSGYFALKNPQMKLF